MNLLNYPSFLECLKSTKFVDCAKSSSRNWKYKCLVEFCHEDTSLVDVWVFSNHTCWIELCSTSSVGISASHDRTFFSYCACFCHKFNIVICVSYAIIYRHSMQGINTIFYIIVLIMSVVIHEVAHGLVADAQGDPTARYAGRLTLNPLKHIDMVGSVILPLLLVVFNAGFIIGWAKPVPYIEANLRNKKWGTILVAGAGIVSNFVLAFVFGCAIRFAGVLGSFAPSFISIAEIIVIVNILLALFNLIPIPPLDGSKILFELLPSKILSSATKSRIEYFSLPLLLVFIIFLWPMILPAIGFIFTLFTGLASPI